MSALGTFGTQLAVAALSLVNVLVIARSLGAEGRGEVAFLGTIAFLTSQLASVGVQQANANLAGREPELRPSLATNSALLALGLGLAAAAIVALLIALVPAVGGGLPVELLLCALAAIPMLVFQTFLVFMVRADYGFGVANASMLVVPAVTTLLNGTVALAGGLTVGRAFGAWVIGQALATALLVVHVQRGLAGFGRPNAALARRALLFGAQTHAGRIMLLGNYKLDQWLVGSIAGQRELGLYSIAVTWAETLFYLPTALAGVQRADLVRASAREAARSAAAGFRAAVLATIPLAIGLLVAAPVLCVTVFGEEFRGSIDPLRVLVPGAFGIVALKVLGEAMTAQRRPLREAAAIAVAFVVIVALDILLIPEHGALGAAVASTVAYLAGGLTIVLLFSRGFDFPAARLVPRGNELPWFWSKLRAVVDRRRIAADAGESEAGKA
ncbi:MAG TPA: oligosaccharide flippase family protein [Gaiellaceae bacterium]|nr:oligosaccharide flippase family protein [Gaiellaceae bacterium]